MKFRAFLKTVRGRWVFCGVLLVLLTAAVLLSLCAGALKLPPHRIVSVLFSGEPPIQFRILWDIRLPRILLGVLAGAGLAVSGALLQGVMHNPLASPGIIGVSSGGGLAGILVLLVFPSCGSLLVPAAFAGSLLTALLIYLLAWKQGLSPVRLILSGVAVSAMLGAFGAALLLFHAEKAGGILDFFIGSLASGNWSQIGRIWIYMVIGLTAAFLLGGRLNLLALGDEVAVGLGVRVERTRFLLLAAAALLAASAVSVAGLLGFVGLIAPHIIRILIGSDNRFVIPASALAGGFLVVTCDTVGRIVMEPAELPVGIILAVLGPPFFLWLLRRHSYES